MLTIILSALGGLILGMAIMALLSVASERREAARVTAALWEIVWSIPITDPSYIITRVKAILEKHGVEIPKGEVVF